MAVNASEPGVSRLYLVAIMLVASLEYIQNGMLNFAAGAVMGGDRSRSRGVQLFLDGLCDDGHFDTV